MADEGDGLTKDPLGVGLPDEERRRVEQQLRDDREAFLALAQAAAFGSGDAVGGDKVGGDKHVHVNRTRDGWRIGPITSDRWADIRKRLAGTPSKEALARILDQETVAVLQGAPETGRRTTALAALAHRLDQLHSIEHDDESPAHLPPARLRPKTGYVFDATGKSWAKRLTESDVLGCRNLLAGLGSHLVILVSLDSETSAVRSLVVDHRPADPIDILHRQLADRLPDVDIPPIIDQLTIPPAMPRQAVDLAEHLAQGIPSGQDVAEICSRLDPRRTEARRALRQQHDERDLGRRAFVIAGAVLDDMPTVQVCRAAYTLAKALFKIERRGKKVELGLLPFAAMLDDWLRYAGEDRSRIMQQVDRRLSFRAGFAPAVLDAVWLDYVVAHRALLRWLTGLAKEGDAKTILKVAHATARFARYDFAFIDQNCINEWVRSSSTKLHLAAAWTLEVIAVTSPDRHAQVAQRAEAWCRGNLRQQSTAVRLLGTVLGTENPKKALDALYPIAWQRPTWHAALRSAVVELYAGGARDIVVGELSTWAGSPKHHVRRLAGTCLTELARLPDATLLDHYHRNPDRVGDLWRRVLLSGNCGQGPWNALREWAAHNLGAEALLSDLHAEPALRPRLRFYRLSNPHKEQPA